MINKRRRTISGETITLMEKKVVSPETQPQAIKNTEITIQTGATIIAKSLLDSISGSPIEHGIVGYTNGSVVWRSIYDFFNNLSLSHSVMSNLYSDDHPQYFNTDRAETWFGGKTHKNLSVGFLNAGEIYSGSSPLAHIFLGGLQGGNKRDEFYHLSEEEYKNLTGITYASNEPTGFVNKNLDSTLSFDNSSRTLTITATGDTFDVMVNGTLFQPSSGSVVITTGQGLHHIVYNSAGTLVTLGTGATSDDFIKRYAYVCNVFWDSERSTAVGVGDERHGVEMPAETHKYLHTVFGSAYISGFGVTGTNADGTGNNDYDAVMGVSAGVFVDEDLQHSPSSIGTGATIPVVYVSGSTGKWRINQPRIHPVMTGGTGRAVYNLNTAGNWTVQEVTNNSYVLYHLFAVNGINYPIISIMGQNEYLTISAARVGANEEIGALVTTGLPDAEFIPIASCIFQTSNSYSNQSKSRLRTTDLGDEVVDWRTSSISPSSSLSDHGSLGGLGDDDHTQYLNEDRLTGTTHNSVGIVELVRSGYTIQRFSSASTSPDDRNTALQSALSAAVSGDTIRVGSGVYNSNNLAKYGVNYYFEPGAIVDYYGTDGNAIFNITGQVSTIHIGGNGVFLNRGISATGRQVFNIQTGSTMYIECDSMYSYSGVAVRASGNGNGKVYINANTITSLDGTIDNVSNGTEINIWANEIHSTGGYVIEQDGGKTIVHNSYIHSDSTSVTPIVIASPDCYIEIYDSVISAGTGQATFAHEAGSDYTQCKFTNCGFSSDQEYVLQGACTVANCHSLDGLEILNTDTLLVLNRIPFSNVDSTGHTHSSSELIGSYYNVKDPAFGAVGGALVDDTEAINNAILTAIADGTGCVVIPPDTYYVTGITVDRMAQYADGSCINIFADGATLIAPASLGRPIVKIGSLTGLSSNVKWRGGACVFSGLSWNKTSNEVCDVCFDISNAYNIRVEDLEVRNGYYGIRLISSGGSGNAYNSVRNPIIRECLNPIHFAAVESSDWVNENQFIGGRIQYSSALQTEPQLTADTAYAISLSASASPSHYLNNNRFVDIAIECATTGSNKPKCIYDHYGFWNHWERCRVEGFDSPYFSAGTSTRDDYWYGGRADSIDKIIHANENIKINIIASKQTQIPGGSATGATLNLFNRSGTANAVVNILNSNGTVVTASISGNGEVDFATVTADQYDNVQHTCPVTIKNTTAGEDFTMLYAYRDLTVDYVSTVVRGSGAISATWRILCSEDRSDSGTLVMSGVCNDDANGILHTSIINGTIPVYNWVWMETTATGGTSLDEFHLTMGYREV